MTIERDCYCCKGMPICDCSHADDLIATVKAATIEYLSHRGERPHRVLRGGQELWETHMPAMHAALTAAKKAATPAQSSKGQ